LDIISNQIAVKELQLAHGRRQAILALASGSTTKARFSLLVQRRLDKTAAVKLMRKLLKKQGFTPDVLVTDKLRSYAAAKCELRLTARHEQGLRRNHRAENSAPAGSSTRAEDAAVQIARISATVLVRSCRSPERAQRPMLSRFPQYAPGSEAFQNWRAATAA
jgi:transposase-like protein